MKIKRQAAAPMTKQQEERLAEVLHGHYTKPCDTEVLLRRCKATVNKLSSYSLKGIDRHEANLTIEVIDEQLLKL